MTFVRPFRASLIALAAGLALASTTVMAQNAPPPHPTPMAPQGGPDGHGPDAHRGFGGPLLAGVDLTDAQRAQVDAILHREGPAMRDRMQDAVKAHQDLDTLVWSGHFDEAQARRIAQSGAQVMVDIAVDHARTESEILAVLTPAQRAQVQANREKAMKFGPGPVRPGPHGPGGPGDGPRGDAPPPPPAN